MALNKFMHPRNLYKVPPDFGLLSKLYPEFSAVSKVDIGGKVSIDFKDANALRILTKCLLKSDFQLDVDIPEDRLVPTLPLRLNYILWLEDLMTSIQRTKDIQGLDIGTGACAIYPLLAVVKNKWKMVGTESDTESLNKAEENVQKNNLVEHIKLRRNVTKSLISHLFTDDDKPKFDFCMCNPPFYSNVQELCESRSPARLPPKNGFTGSPQELITEGGELKFCRTLIKESMDYKDQILIFTTMVGHKYTLSELIQYLKSENITHTHTEFCQGRVTRWGLAWTFANYDIHKLVPPRDKPRKKHTPTLYLLPELPNCTYNIETVLNKIKELLNKLSINHKLLDKRGNNVSLDIIAHTNTWSNQRRKRRQEKRITIEAKKPKLEYEDAKEPCNNGDTVASLSDGPEISSSVEEDSANHNESNESIDESKVSTVTSTNEPIVHAFLKLFKKDNEILLDMEFLNGSSGKEGLHQIVQYIKNNWK